MKITVQPVNGTVFSTVVFFMLCFALQSGAATVTGVVTLRGRPVDGFSVRTRWNNRTTTSGGYYRLTDAAPGNVRIYISPKPPAATPRYYPKTRITQSEEIRCYEMIPYYAADHGPFDYDLRLHRSWGNALDNPFGTASGNALAENTHTLSAVLMKPVYATAVVGEAVWTVAGGVIALGSIPVCKVTGNELGMSGFSRIMLTGYMPIEAAAKVIEIPVKTLLWPVDRLVSRTRRKKLNATRTQILNSHDIHNKKD